uniref:PA2169 family four-helix-bundle protein n=1 Tax=Roseihalotalea indica TaxID=2867963 RepID=A0AA49GUL0_9BACT|nr:PA2169 family four-helix-bundle protein [Tunicatimonas sp. TK19036]
METNKQAIKILNELLKKNYDAIRGYYEAAENVRSSLLASFLEQNAEIRQGYAEEIMDEVYALNGEPVESTSLASNLHRAWINLKTAIVNDKEEAVLEECIRGEKAALDDYEKALMNESLPITTMELLEEQRDQIAATLDELRSMEEAVD